MKLHYFLPLIKIIAGFNIYFAGLNITLNCASVLEYGNFVFIKILLFKMCKNF